MGTQVTYTNIDI